jgi:hypothetical protein
VSEEYADFVKQRERMQKIYIINIGLFSFSAIFQCFTAKSDHPSADNGCADEGYSSSSVTEVFYIADLASDVRPRWVGLHGAFDTVIVSRASLYWP